MAMKDRATAKYRVIADSGGSRYRFFCDVSGMALCTTKPIRGNTQEEELKTKSARLVELNAQLDMIFMHFMIIL